MVRTHQLLAEKYSLSADNIGARGRPSPAARRHDTEPIRQGAGGLADQARLGYEGPTARRLSYAARGTAEDHPQPRPLGGRREHLPETTYRRRHTLHVRQLHRSPSSTLWDSRSGWSGWWPSCSRTWSPEGVEPYVTRDTLRRMAAAIRRFERALATDGVDSRNLGANLRLLESSFSSHNFTFHQYQNVFQFIMGSVTELSRTSILSHDQVLHTVLEHDPRQCESRDACPSTPWPRWCCARCWCRRWACSRSTATCRPCSGRYQCSPRS